MFLVFESAAERERAWHRRESCALHTLQEPLTVSPCLTKHWGFCIYIVWHYLPLASYVMFRSLMTGRSVCQNCISRCGQDWFQSMGWRLSSPRRAPILCMIFMPPLFTLVILRRLYASEEMRWEGRFTWPTTRRAEDLHNGGPGPCLLRSWKSSAHVIKSTELLKVSLHGLSAMFMKEPVQCSHAGDDGTCIHTSIETE